ncbi:hypothetical protein F5B18DRAFT_623736 [Nemania serpens]|nr:hypothetical protein F5B18DRAFT_623736 [Nemania serpens]
MADNTAEAIAKVPVAAGEIEVPNKANGLPPTVEEPVATAEATAPSVPAESTTTEAAAPSADAAAQPEAPTADEAQGDSTNELSESGAPTSSAGKPSDPTPAAEPLSATTEAVVSGVESSASADSDDKAVEPPRPVSLEEVRDETLPNEKALDPKTPGEKAPKTGAAAPVATTGVKTTKVPAADSASAKTGGITTKNKRKAEAVEVVAEPEANSTKDEGTEPLQKKPKTNGTTTNGAARKPGRPRKNKTAVPLVGRTARKTRSQGAAE